MKIRFILNAATTLCLTFFLVPLARGASMDFSPTSNSDTPKYQNTSTNWSAVHSGNGTSTETRWKSGTNNPTSVFYINYRNTLSFNTASLPDDAIIDSGSLTVRAIAGDDATPIDTTSCGSKSYFAVVNTIMGSTTTIAASDYQGVNFSNGSSHIRACDLIVNSNYIFDLNATTLSGVNLTGATQYAIVSGYDIENVDPGANEVLSTWDNVSLRIYYHESSSSSSSSSSSGSLIIGHSACDTFSGTGTSAPCTAWSYSIETDSLSWFVRQENNIAHSFIWLIFFIWFVLTILIILLSALWRYGTTKNN